MSTKRVALSGFRQLTDDELLVVAVTVMQAMQANPTFVDPMPILADVELARVDFQSKLSIARRRGSPYDTAAKNNSKLILADQLKALAFYVNRIADGDLQVLLSSGFPLNSYPQTTDIPDRVRNVILKEGRQSGQMRLNFDQSKHTLIYEYRYGQKPDGAVEPEWGDVMTTTSSRNNLLAPLEPFARYYVQVRATNALGKSIWSESASYIVR